MTVNESHTVSVVIPTIGRESLRFCREAIEKQTRPPDEIAIIADNDRRGAAWARNVGIKKTTGDLIAFLDDDCVPPPEWLEKMVETLDRYKADGVGGTYEETDSFLQAVRIRRRIPEIEQVDRAGLVGTGGNVMYARRCLDACAKEDGFVFNECFKISQDIELAWRLRGRGARLVFAPLRVKHLRRETFRSFLRFQFQRGTAIADLHRVQRERNRGVPIQRSLLWEMTESGTRSRWIRAAWLKALGPFDYRSFNSPAEFLLFWLGEKFQGAGFLFGMTFRPSGTAPVGRGDGSR